MTTRVSIDAQLNYYAAGAAVYALLFTGGGWRYTITRVSLRHVTDYTPLVVGG